MRPGTRAALLLGTAALLACGGGPAPDQPVGGRPGRDEGPPDAATLVDSLRADGLAVKRIGDMNPDFFTPKGAYYAVEGQDVIVFEYPDADAAAAEAARVSNDGSIVDGKPVKYWKAPRRYYRGGRLVVVEVGEDEGLERGLSAALGEPFAGTPPAPE